MKNQKFVAYFRVSTEKQGKSGLGLEAQKDAVASFVSDGVQILASFTEIESGKKNDRPELLKAMQAAKSSGATLLIAKLDRLARNVAFIANLLESGVDVIAVDMPQANKFMLHVMAAVAEQEATAISERTKAALKAAKARGVKLGWANPRRRAEQLASSQKGTSRVIRNADLFALKTYNAYVDVYSKGYHSTKDIAAAFNQWGIPSARGGRWYASSVRNLEGRIFDLMQSGIAPSSLREAS